MTMYLLRQPKPLQCLATDALAAWIATQAEKLSSPTSELQQLTMTKAEAALSKKIEIIRNHFDCKMPRKFQNTLLSNTLVELLILIQKTKYENVWYKSVNRTKVIKRIIESLFTKNLTSLSLNFYKFAMFWNSFLSKSYMLTNLISLDLNFEISVKSDHPDNTIIKIIKNVILLLEDLHSLKYLTINHICTDDILRCLANNCKLIEHLNVSSSIKINDNSIDILTELHYLRNVNLDRTSVSRKGIETLLLSCNNIEHLVIPYTDRETKGMSYILEQIASCEKKFPKFFKIKGYRSNRDTLEELQLIVEMCPLIQNLYIHVFTDRRLQCNVMAVTSLRGLRDLTLEGFEYVSYEDEVTAALKVIGCNLVHLHLLKVTKIDLNALIGIDETCPNLESLSLDSCTFLNHTRQRTKKLGIQPFRKLNKIIFDTSKSFDNEYERYLELFVTRVASNVDVGTLPMDQDLMVIQKLALFLFSNCLNVEFIQLSRSAWLTEDLMLEVLDKNPLINLKELNIYEYPSRSRISVPQTITTPVIDRIIQNCINRPQVILQGHPTLLDTPSSSTPMELQLELQTL